MITNMAADITIMALSHKDIFEKAEKAPDELKRLVSGGRRLAASPVE